ncbi:hypothetical protein EDB84DRAFT_1573933 [Lactarius hengduanensis]|nr:hypothetical protein EDB84DRAFT_1574645 [Lactarius hengduanensis]KAH9049983.1 hypothetical protein EDB84DRAFT_1573933 [Lactarius hengduanensis]
MSASPKFSGLDVGSQMVHGSREPIFACPLSGSTLPTPPLVSIMPLQSVPGQATLPSPRPAEAPYFSGRRNDPIVDFLFEYDINHGLSDSQKVETIVHYIAPSMRNFWKTLDGYSTGDWATFKSTLESLYPDTSAKRYTKRALQEFVDNYAKTQRMRDEDDVMSYYRDFLALSKPLSNKQRISDEERSFEFFQGFHPDDRRLLAFRLLATKPDHPIGVPHDLEDLRDGPTRLQGREDTLITRSDDASSYFRLRTHGCIFCAEPGHHVRQCSTAEYYDYTNRILILNDRLHLPNGQPIPNDGNGRGLKPAIDKWLAANPVRPAPLSSSHSERQGP